MRFKALSTDYILEQGREQGREDGIAIGRQDGIVIGRQDGIAIGRQEERKVIMERLIAGGISPQQAAAFTGISI